MKKPVLDARDLDSLRRQVEELARTYTPEWRFEWSPEDPGAALAELFCQMFGQTIDRFNSIPEKFFVEFLRMIGYQIPGPSCASGTVRFTVHGPSSLRRTATGRISSMRQSGPLRPPPRF